MKVKMLTTRRESQDGIIKELFEAGQAYTVSDTLAVQFINQNLAVEADNNKT